MYRLMLVLEIPELTEKQRTRFWSRVEKLETGCWFWQRAVNANGYGILGLGFKVYLAHRVAFFDSYGRQPSPVLDHVCCNPPCVNPSHLDEVSGSENVCVVLALLLSG